MEEWKEHSLLKCQLRILRNFLSLCEPQLSHLESLQTKSGKTVLAIQGAAMSAKHPIYDLALG